MELVTLKCFSSIVKQTILLC